MSDLRDPEKGCPWDKKQTFISLTSYTVEEAYEVRDAIERQDYVELKSELGDLLFQVVFYAQLAQEQQRFSFYDIVETLSDKLLRRHPHVFAGKSGLDEEAVQEQWEKIKSQERSQRKKDNSILEDIPTALPALIRAQKLQHRVSKVGFEWANVEGVIDKIDEELSEVREAIGSGDSQAISEELGDLLFSCVNLIRFTGSNAEQQMAAANFKFEKRFRALEQLLQLQSKTFEQVDAAELDSLWNQVKDNEKRAQ